MPAFTIYNMTTLTLLPYWFFASITHFRMANNDYLLQASIGENIKVSPLTTPSFI